MCILELSHVFTEGCVARSKSAECSLLYTLQFALFGTTNRRVTGAPKRECAAPAATLMHQARAGSQSRLPSQVSAVRAAGMVFGRSSAPQQRPATAPASGSKSPPAATLKRKDTLSTLMANEPDDLSQLLSLDEDSVHDALRSRYEKRDPSPSPSPSLSLALALA